jgi:hypothetical protein
MCYKTGQVYLLLTAITEFMVSADTVSPIKEHEQVASVGTSPIDLYPGEVTRGNVTDIHRRRIRGDLSREVYPSRHAPVVVKASTSPSSPAWIISWTRPKEAGAPASRAIPIRPRQPDRLLKNVHPRRFR